MHLVQKICSLVLWERQPYMIIPFPYKEIVKALNFIVSKTIHRNFIKIPGMLFLIGICHSMQKYRRVG